MKKFLLFIILLISVTHVSARHIKGGFFNYKYLGPGITDPSKLRYKITLTVYMDCTATGLQIDNPLNFTVFNASTLAQVDNPSVNLKTNTLLSKATDEPCITGDQAICFYRVVVYELNNYELPVSAAGYIISYQRCCRIPSMDNVQNSGSVGNTYSIQIPGTSSPVPDANKNNSPDFAINDTAVVCANSFFRYSIAATDPDNDSLVYSLCSAYAGGTESIPAPNPSDPPSSFSTVPYQSPYNGSQPMGSGVTIDSKTGLLSGIAPPITSTGEYVVTVCLAEYRNGVFLANSRKELHIKVRDCVPLQAKLAPKPVTCDGFTVNFSNDVANPSGTNYAWEFGDTSSGTLNKSISPTPSHTYTDTGVYTVKLRVSITGGLCADSTTLTVKVYPGFFPSFAINPPYCKGVPVSFSDKTSTNYGIPTGWHWDFGNTTSTADTSIIKNPLYSYPDVGTYHVKLIVGNTFGCVDTVYNDVTILDNPVLSVSPKDTSYCALDSVMLTATGTGNFNWTPATNIIGANTATPVVFPKTSTTYYVSLTQNGCVTRDSSKVNPLLNLTNSINASLVNICEADTIILTGNSNYSNVTWSWKPEASAASPFTQITKVFPSVNTTYTLTTRWGNNCTINSTKDIIVKPLKVPQARPNAAICLGQQTAQLQASGADGYQWTPAAGLSNPNIANPVASPAVTTVYKVTGSTNGCTGKKLDSLTVLVRALPPITLTNDTLICSIDTLQLKATGNGNFLWSPNYMISSLTASSPLVSPDVPTKYFLSLTDQFGCISNDSVLVDVKLFVTIDAGNDTTICRTDGFIINTFSDALSYKWTPATGLNSDTAKHPFVTPLAPTMTYKVVGNIGKCQSTDFITIKTVPYPIANAGNDTLICFGQSAQLHASGESFYSWSPGTFLSSTSDPSPLSVKPTTDTRYTVTVTDTLGCPKPVTDTAWVRVYPKVNAGTGISDTSIVIGQPLQLFATGGLPQDSYLWTPSTWLDNANIRNPIASPEDNIEYTVQITTLLGNCTGRDSVKIKVYLLPPSFYVPTAFSPNGDGNNDVLKPIALGMRKLNYFKVFNRLGQLVFSTSQLGVGWDGYFKGVPQDPAAYVWMAEGVTYKGEVITRKGNAVLIR